jgi:8-oxo-dGTP pyrophosphatase MutT (NUDIX family)
MQATDELAAKLQGQELDWQKAAEAARARADTTTPTEQALDRAEQLWGVTDLTQKFRQLLTERGVTIYDKTREHHFTGSVMIVHTGTRRVLLTFHPTYQIWQQLGGHDEGEQNPLSVSAREAWEESGIDDLWMCDWPVRVDPHAAEKCKRVVGDHHNWHYDICYMAVTTNADYRMSDESVDMRWVSLEELGQLVAEDKAQQRAYEMAANALALYDALTQLGQLPPAVSAVQSR